MNTRRTSVFRKLLDAITGTTKTGPTRLRKIIADFAEDQGLVYFGYVDKSKDEHHMVRGATVSPTHKDSHYCVGSQSGYDMVFLQRQDRLTFPGKEDYSANWLILAIDLHQAADLPHIFLDSGSHSEAFYAKLLMTFSQMRRVNFNTLKNHSDKFSNNYSVLTSIDRSLEAEMILTPDITDVIGEHFYPLDVEINGDNLYIYSANMEVTRELLEAMVKNGLWLAANIDRSHELVHNSHIEGVDNLAV